LLNVPRFVALGVAVGYLYKRLYTSARSAPTQQSRRLLVPDIARARRK
jgi:hypothetical protein